MIHVKCLGAEHALFNRCSVEPHTLDAGLLEYRTPTELSLFVSNTGEVAARYQFIPPPNPIHDTMSPSIRLSPFPKWLMACPEFGEVLPGQRAEIKLTVLVTGGVDGVADDLTSNVEARDWS